MVVEATQINSLDATQPTKHPQRVPQRFGVPEFTVAIRSQNEQTRNLFGGCQVSQQQQAAAVGPLQVVEDEHDGPNPGEIRHHGNHCGEEEVSLRVGVGSLRRGKSGHLATYRGDQSRQVCAVGSDALRQLFAGRVRDEMLERLCEELVGADQILLRVSEEHQRPVVIGGP